MQSIAEIIKTFIATCDLEQVVLNYADVPAGTEIEVYNTIHLRRSMLVKIDGNIHKIIAVNGFKFTVAEKITPSIVVIPMPTFIHGTPVKINGELGTHGDIVPLIYLYEIINDKVNRDPNNSIGRKADLAMFYLDNMNPIWTTDGSYTEVLNRMRQLVGYIEEKLLNYSLFESELITEFSHLEHAEFGKFLSEKGHVSKVFDSNFAGIEQRFTLQVKKSFCS